MKKQHFTILLSVINLALLGYLVLKGFELTPDSASYVSGSFLRAPGYPVFIGFFRLFGETDLLDHVCLAQIILALSSVCVFALTLRKYLDLPDAMFFLVYSLAAFPLLSPKGGLIANQIMSESLVYSLLLFAMTFLVRSLFIPVLKNIIPFLVLTVSTTFVKPQFMFMYPAAAAALCFFAKGAARPKRTMAAFAVLFALILGGNLLERAYNLGKYDLFRKCPGTGLFEAANIFYVSDAGDLPGFTEPRDKALAARIYKEMGDKKIGRASRDLPSMAITNALYEADISTFFWETMMPALSDAYGDGTDRPAALIAMDANAGRLAAILFKTRYRSYIRLTLFKLLTKIPVYYMLLLAVVFILSFRLYWLYGDKFAGLLFLAILMHASNYLTVNLAAPLINRYTFPTDILHTAFLLIAVHRVYLGMRHQRGSSPERSRQI